MKLTPYKTNNRSAADRMVAYWRLRLLHALANVLGIQLTFGLRFMPISGQRLRTRKVGNFDRTHPGTPYGRLRWLMNHPEDRKEPTDGVYLLNIEASPAGFYHEAQERRETQPEPEPAGPLFSGLSEAAADRPTAAAAPQAAADEAEGVAGLGALGRRDPRAQTVAEPGRSVGDLNELQRAAGLQLPTSLADLGRR